MSSALSIEEVATYYEGKTEALLRRYGPGPRVHYHTGLFDQEEPSGGSPAMLRRRLVASQERMMAYMARVWQMRSIAHADLLDVGCGLGGGAIFWAQKFGSNVTAITIAPSHVELVARFAALAGVESKVRPVLCDALKVPGEKRFDAAVAIDSTCHLPQRRAWFRRIAELLRSRGHLFIGDWFLEEPRYQEPINRHWCVRVGTPDEYLSEAREAGLKELSVEDISHRTVPFWETTLALIKAESRSAASANESAKFEESLAAHGLMRQGFAEGGMRYLLMSFSKP